MIKIDLILHQTLYFFKLAAILSKKNRRIWRKIVAFVKKTTTFSEVISPRFGENGKIICKGFRCRILCDHRLHYLVLFFSLNFVFSFLGMFDHDHSGTIGFHEFSGLWKYVNDWQTTFRSYDRDNSGTIDMNELKTALTNFGKSCCSFLSCAW